MTENNTNSIISRNFLDFLSVISKNIKFLFLFFISVLAVTVTYGLLTSKIYKATTTVLPVEQNDLLSGLTGLSSLAKSFSPFGKLGSITGNQESDRLLAILRSERVARQIITEFDLENHYEMKNEPIWKILREFKGNYLIDIGDEGHLIIEIFDKNPVIASRIANRIVEILNVINTEFNVNQAKVVRTFIEKRYIQNQIDIDSLENEMRIFQRKNAVISLSDQLTATVENLSNLNAELIKREIELNVLSQNFDSKNPFFKIKEKEFEELKSKIEGADRSKQFENLFLPLKKTPDILANYWKIYKNLEIQYKIAEVITPIYEQAKIEEIKNAPSVQILDKAYPPDRKARPKIALLVLLTSMASLLLGLIVIFTKEYFNKIKKLDENGYSLAMKRIKSLGFTKD